MSPFLLALELAAAVLIAIQAIQRINRMSPCTAMPWFLSWAVLGGSAAAIVAGVLAGKAVPDVYSAGVLAACAAVFTLDRRRH